MTDTPQIVYHNASEVTVDLFTNNVVITFVFPGKEIVRQLNKVGIVVDPNMVYRQITCTAKQTAAQLETLRGYLMPASAPDYTGDYPKIVVNMGGEVSWTIECVVTGCQPTHKVGNKWLVAFTFTEKSG